MRKQFLLLSLLGTLCWFSCNLDKVEEPGDCANPPQAIFSPDQTSGNAPLSVSFDNNSTGAGSYSWSFGDGSSASTENPQHTFIAAGTYTVKLLAISGTCKDSTTATITVNATGPAPVAAFTITNGGCIAPCQVIFNSSGSVDASSFEWDFGDGTPKSTQFNPTHTYTQPGDYLVTLTATSPGGLTDTEIKPLFIDARKFIRTFGTNLYDNGYGVVQNMVDRSYFIIGESNGFTQYDDIYLIKMDETGAFVWEKNYSGSFWDSGLDIIATNDGNYVIVGFMYVNSTNDEDVVLMKINPSGTVLWQKFFGGTGADKGYQVRQTADGGYIVLGLRDTQGTNQNDYYLIKTDASGGLTWEKFFGTADDEYPYSLEITLDGGYAMAGASFGIDVATSGAYFIKTDANGNKVIEEKYANTYYATRVVPTADGGYLMSVAFIDNGGTNLDAKLIKTSNAGVIEWEKIVATGSGDEYVLVEPLPSGDYILTGSTSSVGAGGQDIILKKTDANGDEIWAKLFGGAMDDYSAQVIQTTDGGFIIVGSTESAGAGLTDVYIIKTDKDGNAQ